MPANPYLRIRPPGRSDLDAWRSLWDGYNAFYGRAGDTALPETITHATWSRLLDDAGPVFGLLAELEGDIVGLVHFLYHASTTRLEGSCYLQDLFTAEAARGQGVGRALIAGVCEAARAAGVRRVYWHTQDGNVAGRRLYDAVARHHGFIVYAVDLDAAPRSGHER